MQYNKKISLNACVITILFNQDSIVHYYFIMSSLLLILILILVYLRKRVMKIQASIFIHNEVSRRTSCERGCRLDGNTTVPPD